MSCDENRSKKRELESDEESDYGNYIGGRTNV